MDVIFWLSLIFIVYTYLGYPLIIYALARRTNEPRLDPDEIVHWPSVDIVIPVYNEKDNIQKKLKNLRSLHYPKNKLRILFVSDGSDDGTNAILQDQPDVSLISYANRKGKAHALNTALQYVTSDVVVFADARQILALDSVRRIIARLQQTGVGAVSGELQHVDPRTQCGRYVGLYWRYEKWIRKAESRIHSTAGATGALYAIRRENFVKLKEDTLVDDFEIPIQILRSGLRIVFEDGAFVYDFPQENTSGERKRKIRTLTGNFQSFFRNLWLFSPKDNPIFFQFLSHKVFRLFIPYALLLAFVGSFTAEGTFYVLMCWTQALFYSVGIIGMIWPALRMTRLVSFTIVFLELNWAAVLGLSNYIFQRMEIKWEKT